MAISLGGFSGGSAAATDTLDDVTGRGATTTNAVTVGGLSIGTAYTMPTSDGSANQVLSTDGSGAISFSTLNITGGLEYKGDYTGQSLVTAEKGDFYVVNGSQTLAGVSLNTNDHIVFSSNAADPVTTAMFDVIDNTDAVSSVNGQTGPVNLGVGNLSDVTITGAASGEVLKYDGSAWVDAQVAYSEVSGTPTLAAVATSGAYSDLSGTPTNVSDFTNDSGYLQNITGQSIGSLSDVTITGAASGEYLRYNGSAWVDAALGIADDTTPSLGGNLDVSGNDIVSASNGAIEIAPDGTGSVIVKGNTASSATNTGHIKLNCENNSHHVKIAAPAHSTYTGGSYTLTLPPDDGGADEVLKTDGSGNLSWVAQSSGGAAPNVTTDSSQSDTTISTSTGIEEVHLISNGASNVVITLPAAATAGSGYKYQVKRLGTGNVSVALNGSEYIDHSAQNTFAINAQYDSITLCTDGSNWYLI